MASIDLRHVYSLTDFVRNSKAHVERLGETKAPELLTVNGRGAVVVQDAESYQAMQDRLEKAELLESLRQAMREGEAGLGKTVAEARLALREKHGF